MIITKVQLKNITIHKNNTIEFEDGINALVGPNGTGKSTVLTMIGYALFDYIPGKNQKSYVRSAPSAEKFGTVKIWMIGKDDQEYCVERSIGKPNNKIVVSHSDTGAPLKDVDNKTNLRMWIQDQMGISKNFSLSSIFEHAIGVNQGTFTAPFSMNPGDRSKIFSPLLNVQIYKYIYDKYRDINNSFEKEIHNLDNEISYIEGELKEKDQYIKNRKDLEEKLKVIKKSYRTITKNYGNIKKKFDGLNLIKAKLEKITRDYNELKLNDKNLSQNIETVKEEIIEATKSKEICSATKEDFAKYNEYSKIEKNLQEENKKLQKNIEKKNELNQLLGKLETNMQVTSDQIEEVNKKSGNLPALEKKFQKYKSIEKKIQDLANQLGSISNMQENLEKLIQTNLILGNKEKNYQKSLTILPDLEKNYILIEPLNQKIIKANQKNAILKEEIKKLKQYKKESKGGICPLLHEKCENIEGNSLEEYFQDKIDKEQKKLVGSDKSLLTLQKKMDKLRKDEQKLIKLKESKIELKELLKQVKQNSEDVKNLEAKTINKKKLEIEEKELQNEQTLLEKDVKQYNIIKEKITKELPKLNHAKGKFEKEIFELKRKIQPFKKEIKNLENIPNELEQIQQKMNVTLKNYNLYQENIKSMKKLSKYNQDLDELNKKIQDIKKKLRNKGIGKENLEKQFDNEHFITIEKGKNELNEKSIELREEIKNKEEILSTFVKKLENLKVIEKNLNLKNQNRGEVININNFSGKIRTWFKEAQSKITEALMSRINDTASELFRNITGDGAVQLKWQKDYDIHVITAQNPKREFSQLSGGEQMSAALAVRLAVLKVLTKVDFAFFDEPTTNLDAEKRKNLAKCIQNIRGFKQLFVISHDDTFEESADYLIHFSKNNYDESVVEFLNKGD